MSAVTPKSSSKFVDLPNGTKLYTERWHAGTDVPSQTIICIHGLGSTSTTFFPAIKPILTALPTAHIVAYDWAGSGSSPLPKSQGGVSDFVADLDGLVHAEAGTGPTAIVAHSAGAAIASRWLLTSSPAAQRVTHVVFLGGPINPPLAPEMTAMQQHMASVIEAGGPSAVVNELLPMLLGKTTMAERPLAVGVLRAVTLAQTAAGYSAAIRAFSKDASAEGDAIDWAAIQAKVKVLAVFGEEDVMLAQTDVAGFLDKSPVRKISRAGHTLTLEAPEETAKIIADFIADS